MDTTLTLDTDGRYPVLRTGVREPIDPYKRRLIYARDGYACQWCGLQVEPNDPRPGSVLDLDHVIPWSAFGSDRSDNLRTLCAACNEDRSNYADWLGPPRLIGVTADCYWCARRRKKLPDEVLGFEPHELPRIAAYCGYCGTASWVPSESWIL